MQRRCRENVAVSTINDNGPRFTDSEMVKAKHELARP